MHRVDEVTARRLYRPSPPDHVLARLTDLYADNVGLLERLLGRDLRWPTAKAARS